MNKDNRSDLKPYEVGYKKPPQKTQFTKGQSGNPKGRPRGARNKPRESTKRLRDVLMHEAYREVTLQDKDGPVTMPVAQAAIRSLALKAAKGSIGAQKLLLSSVSAVEEEEQIERETLWDSVSSYKHRMTEYIEDCKKTGQPVPELLPHPDDIAFDVRTGEVLFQGPMDDTDKKVWDDLWGRKAVYDAEIVLLREAADCKDTLAIIHEDIAHISFSRDITDQTIMMRWHLPAERLTDEFLRKKMLNYRVERDIWPARPGEMLEEDVDWEEMWTFNETLRNGKRLKNEKDVGDA